MESLRSVRGPRVHPQLIGVVLSLLPAEDHAAALLGMRANGKPRFEWVSFAAHFDSLMRGRRVAVRPHNETELNLSRSRFAQLFKTLKKDHGVRSSLAHNMTVTPANVDQVTEVARAVLDMPYDMLSLQPAAHVRDDRRWAAGFETGSIDAVRNKIKVAIGHSIPWKGTQIGDPRCNRTAVALTAGTRSAALLDSGDPRASPPATGCWPTSVACISATPP